MRLDKLKIGSDKSSPSHHFKNLKNVSIDFDQDHWVTVVIGWNGTGKSNVIEALAIIFRELIATKKPNIPFAFRLAYRMGAGNQLRSIHIDGDPDREREPFVIHVAPGKTVWGDEPGSVGQRISLKHFLAEDERNLPRYVFSYYSGESRRLYNVFRPYLESYDSKLRKGEDPGLKRLFYALPVHSQFVLLAFLIKQTTLIRDFLQDHLRIDAVDGIDSVLFVLRQPPWKSRDGDSRFWNAKGIVQEFLADLFDVAVAPVRIRRNVSISLWNESKVEFLYLYVENCKALETVFRKTRVRHRRRSGNQADLDLPALFFRDLESTYVSQLIDDVRIRVRLRGEDGNVTFSELSEGEQQLLTVLGLLRFTSEGESLFLLDEPDTHLNPRWSVDYLTYLRRFVGANNEREECSHVVFTTHNPLAIAELVKDQVQVLHMRPDTPDRRIVACHPDMDPRGLGYAAIVTSDMFGIASSLDTPTQRLLERQRLLAGRSKLSEEESQELDVVNEHLDRLGFRFFHPDDEYSRYLRLRGEALMRRFGTSDASVLVDRAVEMTREDKELLADRLISELMSEDGDEHSTEP